MLPVIARADSSDPGTPLAAEGPTIIGYAGAAAGAAMSNELYMDPIAALISARTTFQSSAAEHFGARLSKHRRRLKSARFADSFVIPVVDRKIDKTYLTPSNPSATGMIRNFESSISVFMVPKKCVLPFPFALKKN